MKIATRAVRLTLATQVRAYVEYRMFSAVSRFGRACARLTTRLEELDSKRTGPQYRCSVVLDLMPAGRIRASATAHRLYAAIDAAADRLASGVERRLIASCAAAETGAVQ